MDILTLLEHLANNVHHRIVIEELINCQPNEVKEAFLTNNVTQLRSHLGSARNLPDRNAVIQIVV